MCLVEKTKKREGKKKHPIKKDWFTQSQKRSTFNQVSLKHLNFKVSNNNNNNNNNNEDFT